jgi:hypothetical protein
MPSGDMESQSRRLSRASTTRGLPAGRDQPDGHRREGFVDRTRPSASVPHVNAPVADFPVRRVIGAHHYIADLTLPYGRVAYDYNKEVDDITQAAE